MLRDGRRGAIIEKKQKIDHRHRNSKLDICNTGNTWQCSNTQRVQKCFWNFLWDRFWNIFGCSFCLAFPCVFQWCLFLAFPMVSQHFSRLSIGFLHAPCLFIGFLHFPHYFLICPLVVSFFPIGCPIFSSLFTSFSIGVP